MNPALIVLIPVGLIILGMILNSVGLSYDQPPSSPEQDPIKKLTAEKESYRKFFDLQRSRSTKRQKRVGQYAWLVLASVIGASIWLYSDTVNKTRPLYSHRRAANVGHGRRQTVGFVRDSERWE